METTHKAKKQLTAASRYRLNQELKFLYIKKQKKMRTSSAILLLVAYGHHNCIWCTKPDVRLITPDDGEKGYSKHVESSYQ
jgi:hypothetical protein